MKNLKQLFISLLLFNQIFSGDTVYVLKSEADVKKLEQENPSLLERFKKQLSRLTDTAYVISITDKSTKPLPYDLRVSKKRLENSAAVLKALGLKCKVIDAKTPTDVDGQTFETLMRYFFFSERFTQLHDWDEEMLEGVKTANGGITPYWWNKCDNWGRKVNPNQAEPNRRRCVCPVGSLRQLACYFSHLKALQTALNETGNKTVALFEDDLSLAVSEDVIRSLEVSIDQLGRVNWDVFSLGYSRFGELNEKKQVSWDAGSLRRLTAANGAYAQVINGNSLKKLVTLTSEYAESFMAGQEKSIQAIDTLNGVFECTGQIVNCAPKVLTAGQRDETSLTCDREDMERRILNFKDVIGQGEVVNGLPPISRLLATLKIQSTGDVNGDFDLATIGLEQRAAKRLKTERVYLDRIEQ